MKTLIVYFSRTGNTSTLAEQISQSLQADLEPVLEPGDRKGILGYTRSLWQAATHRETLIVPEVHKPRDYELVVLGTPVWCGNMSSPIRSYIQQHRGQFRSVAFFCTYGGSGQAMVLSEMQALCGMEPIAVLPVKTTELQGRQHYNILKNFINQLHQADLALERDSDAVVHAVVAQ